MTEIAEVLAWAGLVAALLILNSRVNDHSKRIQELYEMLHDLPEQRAQSDDDDDGRFP